MVLTKNGYRARLVDRNISLTLETMGAVCIEGPKWCGKTWTGLNHSESVIDLSDSKNDFSNKKLAEVDVYEALNGARPRMIDEWQDVPKVWDAVRTTVSSDSLKGAFVLTGSSTPVRKGIMHSGAGRIATVRMRTMSLFESGDSSGAVSVSDLFESKMKTRTIDDVTLRKLIYLTLRGGWPQSIGVDIDKVTILSRNYLQSIRDEDFVKIDGKKRDAERVRRVITSLGRNESTVVSNRTILKDIEEYDDDKMDPDTVADYLGILDRMFLTEYQNAFNPGLRSSYRVGKSPKRHLTDPSLSAASMNASVDGLLNDLNTYGFLFEGMCERDLAVYAATHGGTVKHYRDSAGNEMDAVVELGDGRWGAFEIKLGMNQVDEASEKLLNLSERFRSSSRRPPSFLCVLVGMSSYAYQREDGVYVVPITALGP